MLKGRPLAAGIHGIPRTISEWKKLAIYADSSILVVNKPAGIICQPSTKANDARRFETIRPTLECFSHSGQLPWPCHRLDKGTTGALICGRSSTTQRLFHERFSKGHIERKYLAILRAGEKSFESRTKTIRIPLDYKDGNAFIVEEPNGKSCETHLRVLASSPIAPLSLVELEAKTGRKHQLRVHMAHIGAPILGDSRYASKRLPAQISDVMAIPEENATVYLHASYMSFIRHRKHGPKSPFKLGIMAPLPASFVNVCKTFGIPLSEEHVKGGVYIDGEWAKSGAVPEVEGQWL